jgi:hypothetical protein
MDNDANSFSEKELRKVATRAFKKVMDSLKQEPSIIIVSGNTKDEASSSIEEITSWLFHRRYDNGSSSN